MSSDKPDIQFVFEEGVLPIEPAVQEFRGGVPHVEYSFVRFRNTFGHARNGIPIEPILDAGANIVAWRVSAEDREYVVYDPQEAW
jgi:hypothetical protein